LTDLPAELETLLARRVAWSETSNAFRPWTATVDGSLWQVQLNDFPEEDMYTLIVGGVPVGDFNNWPDTWQRP
jgi:hypothetical protein